MKVSVYSALMTALVLGAGPAFAGKPLVNGTFDVALAGPGGEVLYFYGDSRESIIIKNCGNNYSLIQSHFSDCKPGTETSIPIGTFKNALKDELTILDAEKLRPLTSEEVKAYSKSDPAKLDMIAKQKKRLEERLASIQAFVEIYGADSKRTQDRARTKALFEKSVRELENGNQGLAATHKVNEVIDDIVDKTINDEYKTTSVSSARNSDQAIYRLLKNFDTSRKDCGTDELINGSPGKPNQDSNKAKQATWLLKQLWFSPAFAAVLGGVEARIKNCAQHGKTSQVIFKNPDTGQSVTWDLVARQRDPATMKVHEVWRDSNTGKLWGDMLDGKYTQYDAVELNALGKVVSEKACAPKDDAKQARIARHANAGVDEKNWGLPTEQEYDEAANDGITRVLPNLDADRWYWIAGRLKGISDPKDVAPAFQPGWGPNGGSTDNWPDRPIWVRCIGR